MHREEGLSFAQRRDVQSRRVLPDGAGQHPLLPPLHVGEPVRRTSTSTRRTCTSRAATSRATQVEEACAAIRGTTIRRAGGIDFQILGIGKTGHIGFNEPGSGADSRTRLVTLDAVTRRDAAADFFGEDYVPTRSDHDGRRDDPRGARDRDPRDRRAQGVDRAPRRRGRGRPRGRRDVPAAPSEHDVLRRPRRRRRSDAHRDAVAARRGAVDRQSSMVRAVIWLSRQTGKAILKLDAARLRRARHVVAAWRATGRRAR